MTPQIIRTRDELSALDPDTVLIDVDDPWCEVRMNAHEWMEDYDIDTKGIFPLAIIATGDQVRAARQALEAADDRWDLPLHRTEAGYPNCSTCDGGGCPDCTDPA